MVKPTVLSFIYDGMVDWYLRIPHSQLKPGYNPDAFYCEYFHKKDHKLQDVIDRRLEVMKELERTGKRFPSKYNKGRFKSSVLFEEEERNGLYKKHL